MYLWRKESDGGFYDGLSLAEMKSIISSAYTSWSEQDFKRYVDLFSLVT